MDEEDQDRRNKSKGMCGKHKRENKRSETEVVRLTWKWPSGWTPKDRKTTTEVD